MKISDTGTLPPESCIFGQIIAIGSFMSIHFYLKNYILFYEMKVIIFFSYFELIFKALIIVYIRYHYVKFCINKDADKYKFMNKHNKTAFVFGVLSSIGVSIVGNFQVSFEKTLVHQISL